MLGKTARMTYAEKNVQKKRITIMVTRIAVANTNSSVYDHSPRPNIMSGNCKPINTNANAFNKNIYISQTDEPFNRFFGDTTFGSYHPLTIPATTSAKILETCNLSETK